MPRRQAHTRKPKPSQNPFIKAQTRKSKQKKLRNTTAGNDLTRTESPQQVERATNHGADRGRESVSVENLSTNTKEKAAEKNLKEYEANYTVDDALTCVSDGFVKIIDVIMHYFTHSTFFLTGDQIWPIGAGSTSCH